MSIGMRKMDDKITRNANKNREAYRFKTLIKEGEK